MTRIQKHRPYQAVANLNKITTEQKEKVINLYSEGKSQSYIEKELKMTRKTIRTIIKEAGVDRDKSSQWRLRYGSSLNETVFDELTPESLYWIGFLYADGHVRKDKEYSIELEIELKDLEHLKKYAKFLGCNKEPKIYDNTCKLKVYSKVLHSRLKELGFNHDKSYTAKPHDLFKNSRDFWRGVVDGDGSLSNQLDYELIHLCGTKDTIQYFIDYLNDNNINTKAIPRYCKGSNCLHQVNFACKKAKATVKLLYENATVYLDRKYEKYLSWNNNETK